MSYMLPHLHNGWQVDQAILSEEDRVVVIRFGHDWDWKPGSQHAGEKRGVAGLLLGRTERAARAAELQLCAQAR